MVAPVFLLLFGIGFSAASIDFISSTIYDIVDFEGQNEVLLKQCDNGCLIFASTLGDVFDDSPTGYDPYAEKLIIHEKKENGGTSITELSRWKDKATGQKIPLIYRGLAPSVFVRNDNDVNTNSSSIVLYVVSVDQADDAKYAIYDMTMIEARGNTAVQLSAGVKTIMSAKPFYVAFGENDAKSQRVWARLTGFDDAFYDGICPNVYYQDLDVFNAEFFVDGPIISVYTSESTSVKGSSKSYFGDLIEQNVGFVASGGYNGCDFPGGLQLFRSSSLINSGNCQVAFDLTTDSGNPFDRNVTVMVLSVNLDDDQDVFIESWVPDDQPNTLHMRDHIRLSGHEKHTFHLDNIRELGVSFADLYGDQGFLLTYSAIPSVPLTTTSRTTPPPTKPQPPTTSETVPTTTSTTTPSTTTSKAPTTTSVSACLHIRGSMLATLATLVIVGMR